MTKSEEENYSNEILDKNIQNLEELFKEKTFFRLV
jgi:hypothetical protein